MSQRNGGPTRYDIVKVCCFIALIIGAIFVFINNLLPVCGVNVSGSIFNLLALIEKVALLIGIGLGAYGFAKGNKRWVWIVFIVALVVYVIGIVLIFF